MIQEPKHRSVSFKNLNASNGSITPVIKRYFFTFLVLLSAHANSAQFRSAPIISGWTLSSPYKVGDLYSINQYDSFESLKASVNQYWALQYNACKASSEEYRAQNNDPNAPYSCSKIVIENLKDPDASAGPKVGGEPIHYIVVGKDLIETQNGIQSRDFSPSTVWKILACPNGNISYAENEVFCSLSAVAVIPESVPPSFCEATVGNPIDTASGAKFQQEIDIPRGGSGQIEFTRTYSNANKTIGGFWYSSYQKSLRIIDPTKVETVLKKSAPYASKATACTSGFNDLKAKLNDDWVQGSSAQYVNNTCQVIRNNKVIRSIPIVPNAASVHITLVPGAIQLIREDGSILNYGMNGNNQHSGTSGERGRLIAVANAAPVAWRYTAPNGDIEDYNAEGKLLSITASNGMKQELFYDATSGLLSRVKDSTNRELVFAYTGNQLSSVTVDGNKTTSYAYNSLGLMTTVTRPDNTTRIYHYEDSRFPTALTGITDERGKRYATWAYDAQGRAISSEHAGGAEKTLLSFNADGSTTVTNALNKQTIYRFEDIAGARRVVKVEGQPTANCAGANQNYTYTHEGWIASKTDWKGIKTTYQYNTLGQEISRTEAEGTPDARTITTEWHPSLYLKTKVIEQDKETTYSYDENGRLLNQTIHLFNH